jgi:hypothetical protein
MNKADGYSQSKNESHCDTTRIYSVGTRLKEKIVCSMNKRAPRYLTNQMKHWMVYCFRIQGIVFAHVSLARQHACFVHVVSVSKPNHKSFKHES